MSFEPRIVQKQPFRVECQEGDKKAWCACGLSSSQPFCDGTHSKENTGMSPVVVNIEKAGLKGFCGCKHTKNPPYCDGSHNKL